MIRIKSDPTFEFSMENAGRTVKAEGQGASSQVPQFDL